MSETEYLSVGDGERLAFRRLSGKGPGIIFSDFVPGLCDETLSAVDGDFNTTENPTLTLADAHWVAVLVNINYRPFLDKRFGQAEAYALSKDMNTPDGGWMLWIIPLTEKNKPIFQNWVEASQSLKTFIDLNMGHIYETSYLKSLDALLKVYPRFQGDPFLESCFWEKMADLFLRNQSEPAVLTQHADKVIQCLQKAIALGYPSAHLYFRLGTLYIINNEPEKAKKAFLKATRAPINLTNANQYL